MKLQIGQNTTYHITITIHLDQTIVNEIKLRFESFHSNGSTRYAIVNLLNDEVIIRVWLLNNW
jgi:hypothetical protein